MNTTAKFWDKTAEKYAAQPVGDLPAWERKQQTVIEHLRPAMQVLDVGCATGSLPLILAPHCAHVHGLDISPKMARIARDKVAAAEVDNVTIHVGTLETSTQFEAEQFDGLCAFSILHLVDDLPKTLEAMFERLKPGGFFISSTVCLGASWVPFGAILPMMRWVGMAPPVSILKESRLLEAMREAGFVDVTPTDVGAKDVVSFVVAKKPG